MIKKYISFTENLHFSELGKSRRRTRDEWKDGREGQRWGIYMTGAIGYGELSWINSLFTLAGRLLSEAGDVGASGDPALCYGERGACKCGPKSLVGMSPGTIPWFSTTAASIIIRGRPLLDAIVKPRRGGTTSSTLDLFQSNNGTLGHSFFFFYHVLYVWQTQATAF